MRFFENLFGLVSLKKFQDVEDRANRLRSKIMSLEEADKKRLAVYHQKIREADQYWIAVYKDRGGKFRWRIKSPNNRILADSAQGYKTRRALYKSLNLLRKIFPHVPIEEKD